MKIRVLFLFPFVLFGLLTAAHLILENQGRQFAVPPVSEIQWPAKVTFPVLLVLPRAEQGVIDLENLNSDLQELNRQSRQPLAQIRVRESIEASNEYRLTIIGHRWSMFRPPPVRLAHAKDKQVEWVYLVRDDWTPLIRTRLALAGWNWTRIFVSAEPYVAAAVDQLSREQIIRQNTTTQLRRFILNYIDPVTNPADFR